MRYYVFWMVDQSRKGLGNYETIEEARKEVDDFVKDFPNGFWCIIEGEELDRSKDKY